MTENNRIHFIGHACFWITLDGQHFIIDANFSKKILSVVRRHGKLGIDLDRLPDVAALLVTHAHYDHLDLCTYKYFSQKKTMITPPGLGSLIRRFLHNPIVELKPWAVYEAPPVRIIAVPTKHFGFRLSGLRYTECNGYLLQGSKHTVYIPGDTAYGSHFSEIARRFRIDAACLPIGAYRPRFLMGKQHLGPSEALQAFDDLKAKLLIPYHYGSFRLAADGLQEPREELLRLTHNTPVSSSLRLLKPGEALSL